MKITLQIGQTYKRRNGETVTVQSIEKLFVHTGGGKFLKAEAETRWVEKLTENCR